MVAVVCLVACTEPNHPQNAFGGYREQRRSKGRFILEVEGSPSTAHGTMRDILAERAQRSCARDGFSSFEIEAEQWTKSQSDGWMVFQSVSYAPKVEALVQCTNPPARAAP